jgi:antitoxin ParD1/3/4
MTELSKILPPDLESWIEAQVAEGRFFDAGDCLRDLVRKARAEAEDVAWVREQVAEGLASGFIERDAREVLKEIVAERRTRRG